MDTRLMFSSARDAWATPAQLLADIDAFYAGACGSAWYDPCPLAPQLDALAHPWPPARHVYVNPPYGRQIGRWVARALAETERTGADLILLLPARTDTRWFQPLFSRADAICWVAGRLRFGGQHNAAPFPSVLVYCGPHVARFRAHFAHYGHVTPHASRADLAAS